MKESKVFFLFYEVTFTSSEGARAMAGLRETWYLSRQYEAFGMYLNDEKDVKACSDLCLVESGRGFKIIQGNVESE
jgi:hypothetical protein